MERLQLGHLSEYLVHVARGHGSVEQLHCLDIAALDGQEVAQAQLVNRGHRALHFLYMATGQLEEVAKVPDGHAIELIQAHLLVQPGGGYLVDRSEAQASPGKVYLIGQCEALQHMLQAVIV